MGIPPGQLRCINACRLQAGLLCARALCVETVSDLSSAELRILTEQLRLEHSQNVEIADI